MKLLLSFFVVALHTKIFYDENAAFSNFLVNYLFRIAVPIFFLINGYFLFIFLAKGGDFKKWFWRVMALYLVWTGIYSYYIVHDYGVAGSLKFVILGYWHLWYVLALGLGGTVIYFFRRISQKYLLFTIVILYLGGIFLQYAMFYRINPWPTIDPIIGTRFFIHRSFIFFGVPFIGIGYLIAKTKFVEHSKMRNVWMIFLLGLVILLAEYMLNVAHGLVAESIDVLVFIPWIAIPIFCWAIQGSLHESKIDISGMASCIYFMHPFFIRILPESSSWIIFIEATLMSLACYPVLLRFNRRWPHLL
nr:acyltransferase family protein [Pseudacidovorax intermedius]